MSELEFYLGDGCEIHNHCLTCPLPKCKYDYTYKSKGSIQKKFYTVQYLNAGMTNSEIANITGLSRSIITKWRRLYYDVNEDMDRFLSTSVY